MIQLKEYTKLLLEGANYDLENIDSRNVLSPWRLKVSDWSINYILHCLICSKRSTYQVFFFNNFLSATAKYM